MDEDLSAAIYTLKGGPGRKVCQLGDMISDYGVIKFELKEMKAKSLAPMQESWHCRNFQLLRKEMQKS